MGRWAQRSHRGGGPPAGAALNFITLAEAIAATTTDCTYSSNVNAAAFSLANFTSFPSGTAAVSITQITATKIEIEWEFEVDLDTGVHYAGTVTGVFTPQTVLY